MRALRTYLGRPANASPRPSRKELATSCWGGFPFIQTRTSSLLYLALSLCLLTGCSTSEDPPDPEVRKGDPSHHGGTATVRKPYAPKEDDPSTSNDESNDQPLGHLGTVTLYAYNYSSGNTYSLDADVEDGEVERLYFPKGGWVDFISSDIDNDGNGSGTDEQGRQWEFRGLASTSLISNPDDPEETDKDEEEEEPEEEEQDEEDP